MANWQYMVLTPTTDNPVDLYAAWETELGVSGTLVSLDGDDSNWTFPLASAALVSGASNGEFSTEGMLGWSNNPKANSPVTTDFDRMHYASGIQPDMFLGFRFNGDLKSVNVKLQKASGDTIIGGYIQRLSVEQKLYFAIRLSATLSTPPIFCASLEAGGSSAKVSGKSISPTTNNFTSAILYPSDTVYVSFAYIAAGALGAYSAKLDYSASVNNPLALNPGAPRAMGGVLLQSWKNIYQGGSGTIQGITTIEQVPGARQVRLYDKRSGLLVAETFSSPTGHYEFNNLDPNKEYFVVAHDYLRVYNGVISDMLKP